MNIKDLVDTLITFAFPFAPIIGFAVGLYVGRFIFGVTMRLFRKAIRDVRYRPLSSINNSEPPEVSPPLVSLDERQNLLCTYLLNRQSLTELERKAHKSTRRGKQQTLEEQVFVERRSLSGIYIRGYRRAK